MLEMIRMRISALRDDKRGVTAVEYTVIAALIIVAIAGAFKTLGTDISNELGTIATKV